MQNLKIVDAQLTTAAKQLKQANALLAAMKKQAENAKEVIANRLAVLRGITVEALPIGEVIAINGAEIIIEIGKQNRFDGAKFAIQYPKLDAEFHRDFPTIKYKITL